MIPLVQEKEKKQTKVISLFGQKIMDRKFKDNSIKESIIEQDNDDEDSSKLDGMENSPLLGKQFSQPPHSTAF